MIDKIAYELVKSISTNVGFIDKWAGLVKPMRKMVQKTEKVFPVAINTPSNCDQSDYTALVPDDTKRSVAYIEMIQSPTVDVIRHGSRQLSAQLRLVVWYNLDRITVGKYVSEDMLVDQIFRSLPRRLNNSLFNGASQVHVMSTGVTYGAEVVSQYTYNEVKSQFVTHPYGIFAIDLDVWYITTYCQSPFDIEAGCTTGKGNHNNYLTVPSLSDLDAEIVGDNIVFSVVVDTGHSNTVLTLFWGDTELTMTNEVNMGEFTENGTFTFPLPTDYFGVDDIFWLIKATNLNGSVNSDIQGSNVNQKSVFRITVPEGGADVEIYWGDPSSFQDYVGSDWNNDFNAYLQAKTPNTYNWGDGVIDNNDWYQGGNMGISHHYEDAGIYDIIITGKEVFVNQFVDLSFEIVTLPAALQLLYCYGNQLTDLPATLPAELQLLDCYGNQLTDLPATLPAELQLLNCGMNQLTSLPDALPAALQLLDCYGNQLTDLHATLPAALQFLYCGSNQLTYLPDALPAALMMLDCYSNKLNSNAVDNALTNLIAASLSDLQYVDLQMNPSAPPTPSIKAAFIAAYPTVLLYTN